MKYKKISEISNAEKEGQGFIVRDIEEYNDLLLLVKASLWGTKPGHVSQREYDQMKTHTIQLLPAGILDSLDLPSALYQTWRQEIIRKQAYNAHYLYEQSMLPVTVPYVILKGSAAARYYPDPNCRIMGDVDIITGKEDYRTACDMLLENGYTDCGQENNHRKLIRSHVEVEVHEYYSVMHDPECAQFLEDLIQENINPSHFLPDPVNGLVLLQHMSAHLETGFGLRQITDWMMFVHRCLPDEKWPAFRELADRIGLRKLAVAATRMCEIYLGLPERQWSTEADPVICGSFMKDVLKCGNFSRGRPDIERRTIKNLTISHNPKQLFSELQRRGVQYWEKAQKKEKLRRYAWMYTAGRYMKAELGRKRAVRSMIRDLREARERIRLIEELECRQTSKGLARYKDGRFYR